MKYLSGRTSPPFLPPLRRVGFSLVEVMMSLGIAALGFVTMLGLLPQGLQLSRSAAEISAESRINQKLSGELLTASWSQLDWTDFGPIRYFNDQGIELSSQEITANPNARLEVAYAASVRIPTTPMDFQLPSNADASAGQPSDYLRRMQICIVPNPSPNFDFTSAPERRLRTHTVVLAKIDG